jgi:hypothetical protein
MAANIFWPPLRLGLNKSMLVTGFIKEVYKNRLKCKLYKYSEMVGLLFLWLAL